MNAANIITYTTDFGTSDPYASIMKGIVLSINPNAQQIDITHTITAHNIVHGSFILAHSYHYFPAGTIHVAVVDPGVGGERKNIAVQTEKYYFIGPDNGIFSNVLSEENIKEIREIKNMPFINESVSGTFHGRDVYSPCAGFLSAGKNFTDIGPVLKDFKHLENPDVIKEPRSLTGKIVFIDSFGNMFSNISKEMLCSFTGGRKFEIYFAAERFRDISDHYSDVPAGNPLVVFGSTGYLEISMNNGSASSYFMTSVGADVTIQLI